MPSKKEILKERDRVRATWGHAKGKDTLARNNNLGSSYRKIDNLTFGTKGKKVVLPELSGRTKRWSALEGKEVYGRGIVPIKR